jgi:hypothetical protein
VNQKISKKLLILLGVTLVTAGFGIRSLLSTSGGSTENGFDGPQPIPLARDVDDASAPSEFNLPAAPRNPFALVGGEEEIVDPGDDTSFEG